MFRTLISLCCVVVTLANTVGRLDTRIVNGIEATPGEFPHMVTILIDNYHLCGGAIIGNGWVVTAAHCVVDINVTRIAVASDIHDFQNPGSYRWFQVEHMEVHESFNQGAGAYPNDIALLRLWLNGASLIDNIIPVADPTSSFVGETCVMSGWGVTENGEPSNQLRKTNVDVLTGPDCASYWGSGNILDQQICVKGYDHIQGNGPCNYDNGGPLVCRGQLAGIISWGDSDCNIGVVGLATVCASTAYFYDWINSHCNCL